MAKSYHVYVNKIDEITLLEIAHGETYADWVADAYCCDSIAISFPPNQARDIAEGILLAVNEVEAA